MLAINKRQRRPEDIQERVNNPSEHVAGMSTSVGYASIPRSLDFQIRIAKALIIAFQIWPCLWKPILPSLHSCAFILIFSHKHHVD